MVFSSLIFLWIFFPVVYVLTRVPFIKFQNVVLLIASLLFYAWGEPKYIVLMLISILINYWAAILIDRTSSKVSKKWLIILTVVINLMLLGYFKYFNFLFGMLNNLSGHEVVALRNIALPIGISFYTFQALSYVIDVYRGIIKAQKSFYKVALYISFFPQLIAGPIVQYKDIEYQIDHRGLNTEQVYSGVKRFVFGLGKKVILANTFALVADNIFAIAVDDLGSFLCWVGAAVYMLQIYFDFSGYSDMAIGLGRMFGFEFLENFNLPYISKSIKEFWRRWHISLSTWFKEYLYIPLGGNRKGVYMTYVNLMIVFFATGMWHGASLNFIIWGLYHGFFLVIERMFLGKILEKNKYKFFNHVYCVFVVLIGWVIFRFDNFADGRNVLGMMFSFQDSAYSVLQFMSYKSILMFVIGVVLAFKLYPSGIIRNKKVMTILEIIVIFAITAIAVLMLANNTYNPFIYFRF